MIYCLNIPMETISLICTEHGLSWEGIRELIAQHGFEISTCTRHTYVKSIPISSVVNILYHILHHIMAYLPWYDIPEMALSRARQCCRFLATSYTFLVTIILINKQTNKRVTGLNF